MPSLIGSTVTANYLKASPSSQFGTRQLTLINVAQTAIETGPLLANSLFSKTVRALQQTAEVYAVGTPTTDACRFLIAFDTQWDGQIAQTTYLTDSTFEKLEAAILAGSGVAATVTAVAL